MIRTLILIIFSLILINACNDKSNTVKTNLIVPADLSKSINTMDSLDLDNSSFITSNFPDTVYEFLYNESDSLWNHVKKSLVITNKRFKVPSKDSLYSIFSKLGYSIKVDSSEIFASKRSFNIRSNFYWSKGKSDTLTSTVIYWFQGKKYILIKQKWKF